MKNKFNDFLTALVLETLTQRAWMNKAVLEKLFASTYFEGIQRVQNVILYNSLLKCVRS